MYGENPRDGFFRDNVFLHPDLAFEIAFPVGWKTANQRDVVGAVSTEQDAMIQLSVVEGATVDAAADVFFDPRTMRAYPRRATIHGLPAVLGEFAAATQQGNVAGLAAFIGYRGRVFRVVGYGTAGAWPARAASVERAIGSFAELTDTTALGVQPLRVQIVELPGPMSLSEFAAQWPSDIPRERVFLLNQGELATQFPAGALLKRVVRAHS